MHAQKQGKGQADGDKQAFHGAGSPVWELNFRNIMI